MITAAVSVDLREVEENDWRGWHTSPRSERSKVYNAIAAAPDGARVVLMIGSRWPDYAIADYLREIESRLVIEIQGDSAEVVRRWIDAIRCGASLVGMP